MKELIGRLGVMLIMVFIKPLSWLFSLIYHEERVFGDPRSKDKK